MKKYTIKNRIQKQQRENYLEPKVPMHQYKFFSKKKKKPRDKNTNSSSRRTL
jgi:hypothetical protein